MNKVIFGYPRSATKLLANIHVQNGYYNFGELFDTYSSTLINDPPRAVRASVRDQYKRRESKSRFADDFQRTYIIHQRCALLKQCTEKNIVTLWWDNISHYPPLLSALSDRQFLCTRRQDRFEQLLSRSVTYYNANYNDEVTSRKVHIDTNLFEHFYYELRKTELIQQQIVNSGAGIWVDFDQLVTGAVDFGFDYKIQSTDQHDDVRALVSNVEEIKNKFIFLKSVDSTIKKDIYCTY